MTTYRPTKAQLEAADEVAAYDVLSLIMELHGTRPTLDVLRYWYVMASLDGQTTRGRRG